MNNYFDNNGNYINSENLSLADIYHRAFALGVESVAIEKPKMVVIPPEVMSKLANCVVETINKIDWDKAYEAYMARPRGLWVFNKNSDFYCECCGEYPKDQTAPTDFCPNCGADLSVVKI